MSETTRWQTDEDHSSLELETPIGKAILSKIADNGPDTGKWSARIETPSGIRQSPPFAKRANAESWVEQQVLEGQHMADAVQ